jgi:hypothetical protein
MPKIGATIVTLTVFLFAIFMIVDFSFGSYIICMFLPIGYIMMAAGFLYESPEERRVSAYIGMVFSAILALSTFFIGLSIKTESKSDKLLKCLMMIHGVFFISCFVMPMTGVFTSMADGETDSTGTIALLFWCVYFIPIGVLAYKHFEKEK